MVYKNNDIELTNSYLMISLMQISPHMMILIKLNYVYNYVCIF